MNKVSGKKIFKVCFRLILTALVIFMIVVLPKISFGYSDDMQLIYRSFLGTKSEYEGMIEIWNIDTFESGSAPKTNFLSAAAQDYRRKNRGLNFMIRNLTETECMNLLSSGQRPDMFSCSYGVADKVRENLQSFSSLDGIDIREEFLNAGKVGEELYGLAWCRGSYVLISTAKHLEKAKFTDIEKIALKDIVFDAGFKTTNKGKEVVTFSVTYGANKYNLPKQVLSSYNDSGLETNYAIDSEADSQTQYDAYCNFIAGKSTILLGSQRDIIRMENRVKNGKVTDVIYQPQCEYCDLVQFMFLSKTEDEIKTKYMEDFSKFLVGSNCQAKLSNIGMFSVGKTNKELYKSGIMYDIAVEIDGICEVKKVFA